jgi:hypothetical protein
VDTLHPAQPSDAALAIIKGGAARAREIYFPYAEGKLVSLFRDWFPELLDWIQGNLYQKPT